MVGAGGLLPERGCPGTTPSCCPARAPATHFPRVRGFISNTLAQAEQGTKGGGRALAARSLVLAPSLHSVCASVSLLVTADTAVGAPAPRGLGTGPLGLPLDTHSALLPLPLLGEPFGVWVPGPCPLQTHAPGVPAPGTLPRPCTGQ